MTNDVLLTGEQMLPFQREALKSTIAFLNEAISELLDTIGLPKDGLQMGIDEKDAHQFYGMWTKIITRAIQANDEAHAKLGIDSPRVQAAIELLNEMEATPLHSLKKEISKSGNSYFSKGQILDLINFYLGVE